MKKIISIKFDDEQTEREAFILLEEFLKSNIKSEFNLEVCGGKETIKC